MTNAYGTINVIHLDGVEHYEALFQATYRHNYQKLGSFKTEAGAVFALEHQAEHCGSRITIQAGKYPPGTRKRGDIISR